MLSPSYILNNFCKALFYCTKPSGVRSGPSQLHSIPDFSEAPLDLPEITGTSRGIFGGNDAEAETPVLWPIVRRVDSLENTLMLGGTGGKSRRGRQRMRWLGSITISLDMNLGKLWRWALLQLSRNPRLL